MHATAAHKAARTTHVNGTLLSIHNSQHSYPALHARRGTSCTLFGACTLASATEWHPPKRRLLATHTVTAASNKGMCAVVLCYTTTCQNGHTAPTPTVTFNLILDLLSVVSACIAMYVLCILLAYPPLHCPMLHNNTPEQSHRSNTPLNMHQTSPSQGGRRWLAHGWPASYLRQRFW